MGFAPTWLRQVSPLLHKTTLTTDNHGYDDCSTANDAPYIYGASSGVEQSRDSTQCIKHCARFDQRVTRVLNIGLFCPFSGALSCWSMVTLLTYLLTYVTVDTDDACGTTTSDCSHSAAADATHRHGTASASVCTYVLINKLINN